MYLFQHGYMLIRGHDWQAAQPGYGLIHPVITRRRKRNHGSFTAVLTRAGDLVVMLYSLVWVFLIHMRYPPPERYRPM